jgi:thiol-disulfide isomerase/thioredoxin
MSKKLALGILAVLVAGLFALLAAAADQPLSADDITLLLLAGSPTQKIVTLVEQRGISFKMNPDLAKKFHDAGANDDLIEALTKAGSKANEAPSAPAAPAASATASAASQETQSAYSPIPTSEPADVDRKVAETMSSLESKPADLESKSADNDHPYAARFSLVALSGQKIDLADYRGKVVILSFWASWCPYCRKLIPELVGFQGQYYGEGLRVVGIAVRDQKEAVRSYCQRVNVNYPVAMGDADIRKLYGGISGLPTTLLIGRDGRIYRRFAGAPADLDRFEERIKTLLARPAGGPEGNQQIAAKPAPTTTSTTASPVLIRSASSTAPTAASEISSASPAASAPAPAPSQQTPSANTPAPNSKPADVDRKVAETLSSLMDKTEASATSAKAAPDNGLADPSPDQVQRIIQEFAAKEKLFKAARNNYTYHQINKVQELGPDNEIEGVFEQEWDILFDDAGNRIERVTYAPADTLKRIIMTKEDYVSMRNTQPFVLTSDELPEYEIKYLGHVKVDQITAYVFSIRPKEIQKGQQYFQGVVWVDDRDLQIVKSEGKPVPELHTKKGENLFPRFTTWREQIDGKYWFPTYTMADDTLYFSNGPVHIKQILRYTDYKQFKSKVRIVSATPTDRPNAPAIPMTPKQ